MHELESHLSFRFGLFSEPDLCHASLSQSPEKFELTKELPDARLGVVIHKFALLFGSGKNSLVDDGIIRGIVRSCHAMSFVHCFTRQKLRVDSSTIIQRRTRG